MCGEEDGCAPCRPAWLMSHLDLRNLREACPAGGVPKAEPAADAGPAALRSGAALI